MAKESMQLCQLGGAARPDEKVEDGVYYYYYLRVSDCTTSGWEQESSAKSPKSGHILRSTSLNIAFVKVPFPRVIYHLFPLGLGSASANKVSCKSYFLLHCLAICPLCRFVEQCCVGTG